MPKLPIADRYVKPGGFVGDDRKPSEVLGFMIHMAEGNNVAAYLGRAPSRGVSVQYTVEADGEIVAMVDELQVSGSLNPTALRHDDGPYFGREHLDHVLGKSNADNPNRYVISIEMAGRAVDGPNRQQVDSIVRLFHDCRKRYPKIKPLGHRDQQDVKPCPGSTPAIRRMFSRMGGHGKDYTVFKQREPALVSTVGYRPNQFATIKAGASLWPATTIAGKPLAFAAEPLERPTFGASPDKAWRLVAADSPRDADDAFERTAWVRTADVVSLRIIKPVPPATDAIVKAARQGFRDQALAEIGGIPV